jgi:hypothetical protein
MRFPLFLSFFSLGLLLLSCTHEVKRKPASLSELAVDVPADVGIVGPDGQVILYYKDGNYIVRRYCNTLTVLGA